LEVRKTSKSAGIAVKRHFGTPWHPLVVIVCKDRGVKELNVASRAINRMTSLRALSFSSSKATWQMILWPRSPQAQAGEAGAMRATKSVRVTRCRNRVEW